MSHNLSNLVEKIPSILFVNSHGRWGPTVTIWCDSRSIRVCSSGSQLQHAQQTYKTCDVVWTSGLTVHTPTDTSSTMRAILALVAGIACGNARVDAMSDRIRRLHSLRHRERIAPPQSGRQNVLENLFDRGEVPIEVLGVSLSVLVPFVAMARQTSTHRPAFGTNLPHYDGRAPSSLLRRFDVPESRVDCGLCVTRWVMRCCLISFAVVQNANLELSPISGAWSWKLGRQSLGGTKPKVACHLLLPESNSTESARPDSKEIRTPVGKMMSPNKNPLAVIVRPMAPGHGDFGGV